MSSELNYRVLGSLGSGLASPLLAELIQGGQGTERVVLTRPVSGELAGNLLNIPDDVVVLPRRTIQTERGTFGVERFVRGCDLAELAQEMRGEHVLAVIRGVLAALDHLHRLGVGHGGLEASAIRVTPAGHVVLVAVSGGMPEDDFMALDECFLDLELNDHLQGSFCDPAWRKSRRTHPSPAVAWQSEGSEMPDPRVGKHPLSGEGLSERVSDQGVPSKVQLAAVGALTLCLGIAFGWYLFRAPPERVPTVEVPGASSVSVNCPPAMPRPVAGQIPGCVVTASFPDGSTQRAPLGSSTSGAYRCTMPAGRLQCVEQ